MKSLKSGMTRRLVPEDRVSELGDASVPFSFDIHAMIRHDNAPEFERTLHKEFEAKRVNMVNNRKEFFKVSLDEIRDVVLRYGNNTEFALTAEAKEYRQSKIIKEKHKDENKEEKIDSVLNKIPASI